MAANPLQFPRTLNIEVQEAGDATIVRCSGRLTGEVTERLKEQVKELIPHHKQILLDLGEVDYMDSTGLGALVGLYVSAKARGSTLKLLHLSDRVAELLRITKLAAVFADYGQYL